MYSLDLRKLKAFIEDSVHKQEWFAQQIGLTGKMFTNMLSGKIKLEVEAYSKLCVLLQVSHGEFITEINDKESVIGRMISTG